MAKEFEVRREVVLPAGPQDVFAAVTEATAAWMFPTGDVPADAVTVSDPPGRFAVRVEGEDGWFNALEYDIRPREADGSVLRYTHNGTFPDDDGWDDRYDSCSRHTDFYLHALGQYLRHFNGRPATFVGVQAPPASVSPDAFEVVLDELHLDKEVRVGDRLSVELDEIGVLEAEVDYRSPQFLGLRSREGLIRFFGRNTFGGPVGVTLHLFADDADRAGTERAWQRWLDGLYAG